MLDYIHIAFYIGLLLYTIATITAIYYVKTGNKGLVLATRIILLFAILTNAQMLLRIAIAKQSFPLTNLFESLVFTENMLMLVALGIDLVAGIPFLTIATTPVVLAGLLSSAALLSSTGKEVEPKNLFIDMHVAISLISYSAFGLAFISAVLYIFEQRELKTKTSTYLGFLPSLEMIYKINIRAIVVGFVLLTAGFLIGYLQARKIYHGDNQWRYSPKIWLTTFTWFIYFGILIFNFIPRLRGKKVAMASIVSFVFVMLTFLATLFWQDFHSFR